MKIDDYKHNGRQIESGAGWNASNRIVQIRAKHLIDRLLFGKSADVAYPVVSFRETDSCINALITELSNEKNEQSKETRNNIANNNKNV